MNLRLCMPLVVALGLTALATAPEQQPVQPVPRFTTRVDLVTLDVTVLDGERRPIRGLGAQDFSVVEDGKPQAISMFSAIDIPDPEPPSAPWLREVAPDVRNNQEDADAQLLVIVFDDANPMSPQALDDAKRCARSIVDRLGPRDMASVVFVADAGYGQEFTRDRSRLLAAVDRINGPAVDKFGIIGALDMMGPKMALRTLKGQAQALMGLSARRKAVVFISTRGVALSDSLADEEAAKANEGLDVAGMTAEAFTEFGEFVRAAQRANLAVYCLDPGGLRAPESTAQILPADPTRPAPITRLDDNPNRTGIESLRAVATNTGGFPIVLTNDPQPQLTQVFKELRSYYLLAYASPNSRTEGRFRKVTVRVNRPDAVVRTRSGYFEPDAKEIKQAMAPRVGSLNADMSAPLSKPDLPLRMVAAPFAIPGKAEAAVAAVVRVTQSLGQPGAPVSGADVQVAAGDYSGRTRASERLPVEVTSRAVSPAEADYQVLFRLELKPGRYQLRAGAIERQASTTASGGQPRGDRRSGSVYCDLDVPDFLNAPVSMSGLVLDVQPGVRSVPAARYRGFLPVVPATDRELRSSDAASAFVRVYQGRKRPVAPVAVHTRIVDESGGTVFERTNSLQPDMFSDARAAEYQVRIPVKDLRAGQYLLTIDATLGGHVARRDVRFSIR